MSLTADGEDNVFPRQGKRKDLRWVVGWLNCPKMEWLGNCSGVMALILIS